MKRFAVFAAAATFTVLSSPLAAAQSAGPHAARSDAVKECAQHLVRYLEWPSVKDPAWSYVHEAENGGGLHYVGAAHSDDPSHPQFDEIAAIYEDFRPTVVFYEGPSRPIGDTREETIKKYGESGFIRYLATQDGLEIRRLEPNPLDEMNEVLKSFTPEEAGLFFLLREASRFRERKEMNEEQIADAITALMGRAGQMMPDFPFKTIDDLQAAYSRHWSEPAEWWQAPASWFNPSSDPADDLFTHRINRASSEFRNRHMYEVLTQSVLNGDRAIAVVGRNHVPMQIPALRCALE